MIFHETIFPFRDLEKSNFPHTVIPQPIDDDSRFSFPSNSQIQNSPEPLQSDLGDNNPPAPAIDILDQPLVSRPTRTRRPPSYLEDYHCSAATHDTVPTPTDLKKAGTKYPLH